MPSARSVFVLESTPAGTHGGNRCADILRAEPAGKNCRDADFVNNAPADAPIMRTAEGSYLTVAGIMAVEQQEVGDLLIGPGPLNAGLVDDWDRPHDQHPWKLGFERPRIGGREDLHGGSDLDDIGPGLLDHPADLAQLRGER